MKKVFLATSALIASSSAALAIGNPGGLTTATPVPEISALEGTAALAALVAVMLLVWERKRRAA